MKIYLSLVKLQDNQTLNTNKLITLYLKNNSPNAVSHKFWAMETLCPVYTIPKKQVGTLKKLVKFACLNWTRSSIP